jgi:PAS domain S-box-containing protein
MSGIRHEQSATPFESQELRRQAEALLDGLAPTESGSPAPEAAAAILHELRVHQIELEMQNEELCRTQLGLDAQREKYFHLFDLAPVGYLTLSREGIVGDANLTAVRLLRVERQLLFGQPFSAFVLPADRDVLYTHYRRLENTEEPQTCELRLRRVCRESDDGEDVGHFWASLESRPQRTADGETFSTWVTFTGISGRKMAEEALRESEDEFKFFFSRSVVPLSMTRPSGEVHVNDAFCAMLGYTPPEVEEGATWIRLTHPEDVAETQRHMEDLIAGRCASVRYEKRFIRKDGDVVWADVSSSLRSDDAGRPLYFMTTMFDITERRRSEEAALKSAERHETIIQTAMDGFWLMSSDGHLLEVNEAYCAMSGYSMQELLGMRVSDVEAIQSEEEIASRIERIMAKGEDRFESQHHRKDGSLFDVEVCVTYGDAEGGWLTAFLRDITAEKAVARELDSNEVRLEGLLEERERNLQQLAESLSSIIEVVSQVVETRDPYTAGHERRVSELAVRIAQDMDLSAEQVEEIRIAALIHDVGKISVPTEILVKPGGLSPMEFELIKGHSEAGYRILASTDLGGATAEIVLEHHERCDGSGYPRGLTADQLLEESKVIMVADVVEAMSSHRPYRPALGIGPALAEIERGAGLQYDAEVAESCARVFAAGFEFSEHQLLDMGAGHSVPPGTVP